MNSLQKILNDTIKELRQKKIPKNCVEFSLRVSQKLCENNISNKYALFNGHIAVYIEEKDVLIDVRKKKPTQAQEYIKDKDPFTTVSLEKLPRIKSYNKQCSHHAAYHYRSLLWFLECLQHLPRFSSVRHNCIAKLIRVGKYSQATIFLQKAPKDFPDTIKKLNERLTKAKQNNSYAQIRYKTRKETIHYFYIRLIDNIIYKNKCEIILKKTIKNLYR